jgi:hypothetical protein
MRFMVLAIPALAVLTAALQPPEAPPAAGGAPCGTMANTRGMLDNFTRYFVEDQYALMRGADVQQLALTAPRSVVADTAVCQAVLDAALLKMRTEALGWSEAEAWGFEHAVLQFGPYYVIPLRLNPNPSTGKRYDRVPLLVFRGPDMLYLRTWVL